MNIVEAWKDAFEFRYKDQYDKIFSLYKHSNEHQTFIALYQMIQDAFKDMCNVDNLYISSSFYKQLQLDMERLDDLILLFIEADAKNEKE